MRYVIIGGVAGGATAAARLRRLDENASITIIEKGEYISYANCGLPYYIGNIIKERDKLLVQTAASFSQRFNIDVRILSEAIAINRTNKKVKIKNVTTGIIQDIAYDKLILSVGAAPFVPPTNGIASNKIFTLRNVADTDKLKNYIQQNHIKKAIIVGAGFIGLEMAENFHHLGIDVSIVEMGNQILAPADVSIAKIAENHLRENGIDVRLQTTITNYENGNENNIIATTSSGEKLEADMVLLSIGVRPDTHFIAEAGLEMGNANTIVVNDYLQTSDEHIYAVGDAIEFENPITKQKMPTYLAGPANKQGRMCADNIILGNTRKYKGSVNTAILKLFDLTVAISGVASKNLEKANISHQISFTLSASHASYYPDATQLTIQLAFNITTGQILGAQIIGKDGVDKRIDILSHFIQTQQTIFDLMEYEHAYAPPFSSAKDPVNMAAFVAENILQKRMPIIHWFELKKENNLQIIDVRSSDEFKNGKIENALHIPVDELRTRCKELDKQQPIVVYCQVGMRGYIAQQILLKNGFPNVRNLSGGYYLYNQM
ncbi:MAG: FAD-dependent oxidoreductase [Chitinophagales bacterium]